MSALLNAALAYAERGLPVFPLKAGSKRPIFKGGHKNATTDQERIRKWWREHPNANIGLATGHYSNLVVLDVDIKNGIDGEASLRELVHRLGALPQTLEQRTASGGRHLIYKTPQARDVRNSAGTLGAGLDLRGEGGYVVIPPSVVNDHTYCWTNELEPAPAPDWLVRTRARNIPEGSRNSQLASVAGSLRARGLETEAIERALIDANTQLCSPPLNRDEVLSIARGITSRYPARRPYTDLGNAERLVDAFAGQLKYCPQIKSWLRWDGTRWVWDGDGGVHRAMRLVVRGMYAEAAAETDENRRAALAKWAARSEAKGLLRAAVELAAHDERVLVNISALDANPWLLGVRNGTVDLQRGTLAPSNPEDLITKQALVTFDDGATCPLWEGFLRRIFAEDLELISYVQRAFGYSLTGNVMEKTLFFLYGPGGDNGKSTMIETLVSLLGDYALKTRAETFMQSKTPNTGATPERVALRGARLVVASELSDRQRFDEGFLKDVTGGIDRIAARNLYEGMIEFRPEFKLWLYGNHRPQLRSDDSAAWRRLNLIPFEVSIPLAEQDQQLGSKLIGELPGILNWMLVGLSQWRTMRLAPPPKVVAAVGAYREDMDDLGRFLEECIECLPEMSGVELQAGDLYQAFQAWAIREGNPRPMANAIFSRRLTERGLKKRTVSGRTYWQNLCLRNRAPGSGADGAASEDDPF